LTTSHATAAVACALAVLGTSCASITGDANAPIAIEFVTSHAPPDTVEEFDTVPLHVRVRNRAGDSIPGAPVRLVSLNPDTLAIDSALLAVIGVQPGPARVVAISANLHSDPLPILVVRAPDSLVLVGPSPDTVRAADSASAPLVVQLLDLRTAPPQALGLAGRPVTLAIVYPAFVSRDSATVLLGNDSLTATVTTVSGTPLGGASVIVKRRGAPPQPDSVVVQASARRAVGTAVRGSPVRFIVRFQ
jgi:hypothetical protein